MSLALGLSEPYFGSSLLQYIQFFFVVGVGALLGRTVRFIYKRRLEGAVERTKTEIDDIILHALGGPFVLLSVVVALAIGREFLTPVEPFRSILALSIEIPVIVSLAWIAVRLSDGLIEGYMVEYAEQTESKLDDELIPIVSRITNIAIVSISGVVILDSIGYDVTALVASLGVGGIAIAYASRKTLADLFGGAHILSTKPFLVDDVVEIDDTAGTVEDIGLRTTRIRDFDGRVVTISNSAIADAEIRNITSESARRIKTYITLSYETTPAEMANALAVVQEAAAAIDGVNPDDTGAWFWDYGDLGIKIRLEYYIDDRERWKAVRNDVNREVHREIEEAGFELAVPNATIHTGADEA